MWQKNRTFGRVFRKAPPKTGRVSEGLN
jgi:hypothetical protein